MFQSIRDLEKFFSLRTYHFLFPKIPRHFWKVQCYPHVGRVIIHIPPGSINMARSGALLLILGMIFDGQRGITLREGLCFWKTKRSFQYLEFLCLPSWVAKISRRETDAIKLKEHLILKKCGGLWVISGTAFWSKIHPKQTLSVKVAKYVNLVWPRQLLEVYSPILLSRNDIKHSPSCYVTDLFIFRLFICIIIVVIVMIMIILMIVT